MWMKNKGYKSKNILDLFHIIFYWVVSKSIATSYVIIYYKSNKKY